MTSEPSCVRETLVEDLCDGLFNPLGGECLALAGGPQTGKTRVLEAIAGRCGRRGMFIRAGELLADRSIPLEQTLLQLIDKQLEGPLGDAGENDRRVVIVDDFDLLLAELSVQTLQCLRERFSRKESSLLLSTREYLSNIAHSAAHVSRFDAIFAATRHTGPLSDPECVRLIRDQWGMKRELPYEMVDLVRREAGCHPGFVVTLMKRIRQRAQKGAQLNDQYYEELVNSLPESWAGRCHTMWNALSEEDRVCVIAVCSKLDLQAEQAALMAVANLRCAITLKPAPRAINPTFERFIVSRGRPEEGWESQGSHARAREVVAKCFTTAERDPDPLYYLGRAVEALRSTPPSADAANAMLRTAFENFLKLASRRTSVTYGGMTGDGGPKAAIVALAGVVEAESTWTDLVLALFAHLNKQGSHPGRPADLEDTLLRLGAVCGLMSAVSGALLRRAAGTH